MVVILVLVPESFPSFSTCRARLYATGEGSKRGVFNYDAASVGNSAAGTVGAYAGSCRIVNVVWAALHFGPILNDIRQSLRGQLTSLTPVWGIQIPCIGQAPRATRLALAIGDCPLTVCLPNVVLRALSRCFLDGIRSIVPSSFQVKLTLPLPCLPFHPSVPFSKST